MVRAVGQDARESVGKRDLLVFVAVALLATLVRIGWPTLTEFKFDEARVVALALGLVRDGRVPLAGVPSSAGFEHSPISVYLFVPAFLLTNSPIPATVYGGLMGVAAVVLCWWLARHWPGGGPRAALIAALLFAVSPWAVLFTRKIWQVAFVPVLSVSLLGLIVSALVGKRHWNLAWALATLALLVQVHPSTITLGFALVVWLIVFRHEIKLAPLLVGLGLGVCTAIPFLVHQLQSGWPILTAMSGLARASWDLAAVRLAWEVITGRGIHALAGEAYPHLRTVPQLSWTFNLVGWLTVAASLGLAWRTLTQWGALDAGRRKAARIDFVLLVWLAVPVIFNLRHSLELYLHSFSLIMPAAYLAIGRALEALADAPLGARTNQMLGRAGLIFVATLALAQLVVLALMASFVSTTSTPGGFGKPLGHYLDVANQTVALAKEEGAVEVLVVGPGDSVLVDQIPAIFDVLLRDRIAYRFVDSLSTALFPPHKVVALLTPEAGEAAAWYEPELDGIISTEEGSYGLAVLSGSWPEGDLEPVSGPRLFQNGIELQGYQWVGEPAAGAQSTLWLLWQVLWLSPEDTHFSARAVDREGQTWGQYDTAGYPHAERRKGDRVISKFDINLDTEAPAGPYRGLVSLYLFPQVISVPVIDEVGNPISGAVEIGQWGGEP